MTGASWWENWQDNKLWWGQAELINASDIRWDGRKGAAGKPHKDKVSGEGWGHRAQSMKSTMQIQQARARQPPATMDLTKTGLEGQYWVKRTNSLCGSGSPHTEADGRRVSQQDSHGVEALVCYRGHKSAAWHRVSSVRQPSQTAGMFQSTGPTDKLTAQTQRKKNRGVQGLRPARLRYETPRRETCIKL